VGAGRWAVAGGRRAASGGRGRSLRVVPSGAPLL